jgi:4-amino-4-deoxy-L-arabinose transferase-like glycosyltransferase
VALLTITAVAAFLRLYQIDRIPPGDGYDPAFHGLDALEILEGARPVFLETNFGREVMFSYLVAACFAVLGAGTTAIHVTSALAGILTVPAVYLVAREIFATDEDVPADAGGLVAALTIATSFSHLSWSRYGVRAILVPLFAAVTITLLWRGLRVQRYWMFIACGVCLGLSLYTYQAARMLLPLALFAHGIWHRHRNRQRCLMELGLAAGATLVIFAPMGWYALNHPGSLMLRANQIAVWSAPPGERLSAIFTQLGKTALTFSIRGDTHAYSNIPGRPALNPFLSLAFHAGLVISLWRIRKPSTVFLLAWLGLMCAPAILARSGPVSKRIIGAWPAVAMLIAVGLLVPYRCIRRRIEQQGGVAGRAPGTLALVAMTGGFVYTGAVTVRDYFVTLAQDPYLPLHFEAGLSAIGRYIGELPASEQVYLSPAPAEHPTIILHSQRREDITGYNGRVCLVLPSSSGSGTTYVIVPQEDKNSQSMLKTTFPEGDVVAEGPRYLARPYFLAYGVPGGIEPAVTPTRRLEARWREQIALLGYDLDAAGYSAGDTILLTLYYRSLSPVDTDYTAFVHLLGPPNPAAGSPMWGQVDAEPCAYCYPTSHWETGEWVIDHLEIAIPDDAPAGVYDLVMGFYEWPTLNRLPVSQVVGQVATDNVITLERIHLTEP